MKILIVDDEPLFLELVVKYLNALGYEDTHAVTSASEALKGLDDGTGPFDCFLLDIRMPGMDGVDLCANIRARPDYAATPILMITAMTEKTYVDQAFRAGANDYVTKPIDRNEIAARMGMVRSLVAERARAGHLRRQLDGLAPQAGHALRFEDPILLEDAGGAIALSSMENYLLRLGNLRLFGSTGRGFHVENAALVFSQTDGLEFADILSEVAIAIQDHLGDGKALLTYAGQGDFCAVQSRIGQPDDSELDILINDSISRRLAPFTGSQVALPVVRVGRPQSSRFLPFDDPTSLIYRAIEDARSPAKVPNGFLDKHFGGQRRAG